MKYEVTQRSEHEFVLWREELKAAEMRWQMMGVFRTNQSAVESYNRASKSGDILLFPDRPKK